LGNRFAWKGNSFITRLIHSIGWVLSASLIGKFVGMLQTIWLARILDPEDYGRWVTLGLMASYAPILCLGTMEALLKNVPYYNGKNDTSTRLEHESAVWCSVLCGAGLFFFALLAGLPFIMSSSFAQFTHAILWVGAGTFVSLLGDFFYHRAAAHERFRLFGLIDTVRAVSFFALIIPLAWWLGLAGAALAFLVHHVVRLVLGAYWNFSQIGPVRWQWNRRALLEAITVGFPITLVWWAFTLQMTIDRVISGTMLGAEATGLYGLGLTLVGLFMMIGHVAPKVFYPRINRSLGAAADRHQMHRLVCGPALGLGLIFALLQAGLVACLPFLLHWALPKYFAGLGAAQILILGAYFLPLVRAGGNYLVARDRHWHFLLYVGISLLFSAIMSTSLVWFGCGIEGIALGTSSAGFILVMLVWREVMDDFTANAFERARQLTFMFLPFAVLVLLLVITGWTQSTSPPRALLESVMRALLLSAGLLGVLAAIAPYRSEMLRLFHAVRGETASSWKTRSSAMAETT
jgi:O-antigen/teichoic acid export membrane protein